MLFFLDAETPAKAEGIVLCSGCHVVSQGLVCVAWCCVAQCCRVLLCLPLGEVLRGSQVVEVRQVRVTGALQTGKRIEIKVNRAGMKCYSKNT